MYCRKCGAQVPDGAAFCNKCGFDLMQKDSVPVHSDSGYYGAPGYSGYISFSESSLPEKYRPLGAWAYFGYALLFSIPIIGFIFLIVFSVSDANINRRNYARSFWCILVVALIVTVILAATGVILIGTASRSYRYW